MYQKKHQTRGNNQNLTQRELAENHIMKKTRESIEWSYALHANLWKEVDNWKEKKLDMNTHIHSWFRVLHIFTNMYVCLHGSQISNKFLIDPPSLEEYLVMN